LGYTTSYIHLLRHRFKHGKLDFAEPPAEGPSRRRRVSAEVRQKIRTWRERRLSAAEITELLLEDGVEISVRTVRWYRLNWMDSGSTHPRPGCFCLRRFSRS
jgi:DNA-directed RNA polymerase specialized sigma54-like protein